MTILQHKPSSRSSFFQFCICAVFLLSILNFSTVFASPSNEIIYWNEQALSLIKKNNVPPPKASRILGLLHVSMFDAVNSSVPKYEPYDQVFDSLLGKPLAEVAAEAAAYVLKHEFPDDAAIVGEWINQRSSNVNEFGVEVAQTILDRHPLEFNEMEAPSIDQTNPWVPTAPQFAEYLLPKWCALKPLSIVSVKDYRKNGPPKSNSPAFIADAEETKLLGSKASTKRTADQTEIALFWADGRGTVTPPGHWNQIAAALVQQKGFSILDSARAMALLNIAMADAAIVAWDMKYMYQLARPITMFAQDGWEPLITTPPFPEYVSGHSTFSGAAAEVLTLIFGKTAFTTQSDGLPNVVRQYDDFYHAADEAGRSRIYGGIHFEFSNRDGQTAGQEIGRYVVEHFMQKRILSSNE
jgi:hypothetical protein